MGRKSKQAGGNMPLTHYERTKKFASSEYGTTSVRLAGHSQYQIGYCALSITCLDETNSNTDDENIDHAMCTPSGYLYSKQSILEYMLTKKQELNEQQIAYEKSQQQYQQEQTNIEMASNKKMKNDFDISQNVIKKRKINDDRESAQNDLKRTSYWLANSQPDHLVTPIPKPPISDRPLSPFSQQPLRRKDIWPVRLEWNNDGSDTTNNNTSTNKKLVCSVSHKTIQTQPAIAYWTKDTNIPGTVVLEKVFNDLIGTKSSSGDNNDNNNNKKIKMICPTTGAKIKHVRKLQQSGSSFAASGQNVQGKQYRPTIT
jgi:hypothetical protein